MKNTIFKRAISLLLALACVVGILPLSAFADTGLSAAPSTIAQSYCDYMYIGGRSVRYKSASDTINATGLPYVFHEQVSVPGLDNTIRALCSYHAGSLGGGANGQKWNFKKEVDNPSLKLILTWVYSCTYGDFTEAGDAAGMTQWGNYWSDIWFLVSQSLTWYYEYGIIIDYTTDKEGFIKQAAEEFVAAVRMYNENEIVSSWITDWDSVTIYDIIDSADGGVTGNSAYDYIIAGMNAVLDHPEYYYNYHLWEYEWDTTQPWKLAGHSSTEMQRLLIAVPDREPDSRTVKLTIKKLEAGTNQPIPGVTFKIENVDDPSAFSVTRQTGADGTIILTRDRDGLDAGQYRITEEAAPEGYIAQTESRLVTLLPGNSAENEFTFYNTPISEGEGSIRKVDSDNPSVGLPGAVIRITSIQLDEGGSFTGTYTTKDGGYISSEDLDFSSLPAGSYLAEEITPPEGYVLSSDLSKRRQTFVWDGETDVSLIFENSAKVKVELKKVAESGSPLAGAVFLVLRDGQIISTEETKADGTITVPNVSEGYYEFREVSAPAGFDCDRTPVGVHVSAEDLQGEQTITVTKVNYHKRPLTISKRDAETGAPIANTSFHIRGVNVNYENDVVTGADGKATLPDMASGCYEITETNVPAPYLLDTNNHRTIWIDASEGQDVVVDFVNSTRPGLRLVKMDHATGKPIAGVTFLIEQVGGGYSRQHATDENGLIMLENLEPGAYTVTEVKPAPGYVADATPRAVWLEQNRTTTLELTNVRKPDLRILKYDQQSGKPLAGVTFEVWHDSELLGEYTTNESGEIYLSGLELGTYLVKEVATDDEHVVSTTPQQIELTADRTETAQLIFFNSKKPGIHLIKVDSVTMKTLPNVRFEFKLVGASYRQEFATDINGEIDLAKLTHGTYEVRELEAPDGYLMDDAVRVVRVNPDEDASFVFTNTPKPSLRLIKTSSDGSRLGGVHFRIARIEDGTHYLDRITDTNGEINISSLEPGVYSIQETATVSDHIMELREYHVELFAGQTSTLTIENQKRPNLIVYKNDADNGEPVPNTIFLVKAADGHSVNEIRTDKDGKATLANLLPGVYEISEKSVPAPWLMDAPSQLVTLYANRDHTVYFKNHKKPTLTINKVDSVTGSPIKGAKFQVWYGSNSTATGELNSLGTFYSNADGQIVIDNLRDGWYKVTELEPAAGYTIKQPATQEFYIKGGESKTVTFENVPKNAIALEKYDSVTGEALAGCTFQLKYLGGTSGTGGTVIGQKVTDKNGTAIWTGLNPGTYILEEIDPADGYNIIQSSETIFLADNGEQSVITVRFNNAPDGILLVRKVCATNPSVTLQNAEFKIMYTDGTLIGNSNGIFRSDENGEIRIVM